MTNVFIDGEQGTTGLQIHDRLRGRADITLMTLPVSQRKHTRLRAEMLNSCDIAILCLPDEAAREAVAMVKNPHVRVIDASSAHRVTPGWTYGFPEMSADQPDRIRASTRITNPGCYPTGAIGLLLPLVNAGLLPADYPLSVHAVSGYSGGGRAAIAQYEGEQADAAPAFQVYGLALRHKHVPEMTRYAGFSVPPVFMPAYGGYRQGIVVSVPLQQRLLTKNASAYAIHACLTEHYRHSKHVRVRPGMTAGDADRINPERLNGTNDMELGVFANPENGQILLTAVFDNLGKGASGAAVQNLNLLIGAD
ncbi:TPA: N-acetyl-gamma-glutamyl-phosphate reductase [Kluyvera intermedia]|nr:N-acetyl-gamma-glutamyl-phosphate reductase [Kluyvera intermedia]HAT2682805.1 N-acetyl-gamma-glutamyl-phosphate reductase [Kluyvera intermedia]HAT2699330.1 N-acetyl-gamma-glutamyl-phosphate reductase [Kluyvera intermedia]HAT2710197.1 N-acetyl-gamma-glutamyl-phosphate reductase [Kluyvera intermedia]